MLKKYRVHELAKDLNTTSKELTKILSGYFDSKYNHMSSLQEDEIDLILEIYTKKIESENFDDFFGSSQKIDITEENLESIIASYANKKAPKTSSKEKSVRKKKKDEERKRRNIKLLDLPSSESPVDVEPIVIKRKESKAISTRIENINIQKYDKKYEDLASAKNFGKQVESSISKQKFSKNKKNNKFKKRESEAERLKRIEYERKTKPLKVLIPDEITVAELSSRLKATVKDVVKKLISLGVMSSANDVVDFDTASLVALEFYAKVEKEKIVSIEELAIDEAPDPVESLKPRPPVVVVMGHVDHGKTSILDYIRKSNVTSLEHGGITQHIGAYKAKVGDRSITFLDTPGHEAFTSMRARGAKATDVAIVVVAADDGIMPQTVEAINHAKDAKVAIVVAINKIDKPGANIDRVKQQLTEYGLVPEEWGGDTICVPVSAKTGEGIDNLLEAVSLSSDILELRANPSRNASGVVIESRVDKGRGVVSTFLVMNGSLKKGDIVVSGTSVGKIRSMQDSSGLRVDIAIPADPVEVTGLDIPPMGGEVFNVVLDETLAHKLVEKRKYMKSSEKTGKKVNAENIFDVISQKNMKTLKFIVKADVSGSAEALKQSLEKLSDDQVLIKIVHSGVGVVNESDVMLASVSNSLIIGFNVRVDSRASVAAHDESVEIRTYRVIYDCINDVKELMKGLIVPEKVETKLGTAECIKVFNIPNVGTIAGCYVSEGKIIRGANIRLVRDGVIKVESKVSSLQRNKNDAKEVAHGFECGILMEKFGDIKVGDIVECYSLEEQEKRK